MKRQTSILIVAMAMAAAALPSGQGQDRLNEQLLAGLELRGIGPGFVTGRIQDVEIDPKNPSVWYVASAFGGLWKTENRGISFTPIFDNGGSFTLCCVVVDPKDSNVVWLGTGENTSQRSAHFGDGVYKSTDAGKTWKRMGLEKSEHLGEILIDPRNSNVVYVSAQGPLWAAGGDRGLYKTADGGETWNRVLHVSDDTGISDIRFQPGKPDVIYASAYQRRRAVGQMIGGGPEGGIYKTTDGGKKWTKLTKGLPTGDTGRAGLAVDARNPNRVYALIDAKRPESGFFRSDDAGASWTRIGREVERPGAGRGGGGRASIVPAQPPTPCQPLGVAVKTTAPDGGLEGSAETEDLQLVRRPGGAADATRDPARDTAAESAGAAAGPPGWPRQSRPAGRLLSRRRRAVLPRDLRRPVSAGLGVVDERQRRVEQGRWQDLERHRSRRDRRPRRSPLAHVRSDRPETPGAGQRRRPLRVVRRGEDLALLHQPADHPVLPAVAGQRQALLQRLRRHPGQLFILRPVALGQPVGRTDQRLVHHQRRRRLPVEERSRRPDDRLRSVAGRQPLALRPADRRAPRHPPAAIERHRRWPRWPRRRWRWCGPDRAPGAPQAPAGAVVPRDRSNWDTPFIISPHSASRLYWASEYVYRSDDRGDTWTRISPDLTRKLDPFNIPIMGKVWPRDSVALNTSTTALSNVVSLDESPLLEGLLYAGTDDGLLQISEDGGKNWRKVEDFPGVPKYTYVSDVAPSPRDANTVFVALNNWQRGDFKPYLVKSADRGKTWTNITGNLPDRHDVWTVLQDHENGNLLFAGTEFGLFVSVDGGGRWVQMKGGLPVIQVRDMAIQRRENDLVLGTFGRGFYILDDYSALRDITPQALADEARLFPLRDAYLFTPKGMAPAGSAGIGTLSGNTTFPNPPTGAVFTYSVGGNIPADAKLVLTISNEQGQQIRRLDVDKAPGLRRVTWNLRGETPAAGQGQGRGRSRCRRTGCRRTRVPEDREPEGRVPEHRVAPHRPRSNRPPSSSAAAAAAREGRSRPRVSTARNSAARLATRSNLLGLNRRSGLLRLPPSRSRIA